MKFAVVGAGAVGGYLAAELAADGADVVALARGAHLEAIRRSGLTLRAAEGETVAPIRAVADAGSVGVVDFVLVTVKAYDLESADLAPMLGPDTAIVPFLNGVEAPAMLDARYGAGRAMVGVARISASIVAPGVIGLHAPFARFEIGEVSGAVTPRLEALRAALAHAGVDVELPLDPVRSLWRKFLLLAAISGVTAGARCDLATVRSQPMLSALYRTLAEEAAAVGAAAGADVGPDDVAEVMQALQSLPGTLRASMAHDLAAGKRLEVDWLAGAVSRLGDRHGVPTPANDAVWALLRPHAKGAAEEAGFAI